MPRHHRQIVGLLLLFVLSILSFSVAQPVYAATITVNTDYDDDFNPDPVGDNDCSLREAIQNANTDSSFYPDCAAGSGDDVIVFDSSVTSITLTNRISVISTIRIDGDAGSADYSDNFVINGSDNGAFELPSSDSVLELEDLTIQNSTSSAILQFNGTLICTHSRFTNNSDEESGGAIDGIGSSSVIDIDECLFDGNSASNDGGAIAFTGATLTIDASAFVDNEAGTDIDPINPDTDGGSGGAIARGGSQTESTLTGVYFSGNTANANDDSANDVGGGAIYIDSSDGDFQGMVIIASTFAGNQTVGQNDVGERPPGGAILNDGGNLLISYSHFGTSPIAFTIPAFTPVTVSISGANTAAGNGGAVAAGAGASAVTDIVGTSFFGNSADSGGALWINAGDEDTAIYNSTISNNTAGTRGGGIFLSGSDDEVLIVNVTIADNSAPDGSGIENAGDGDSPSTGDPGRIDYPDASDFDDVIVANTILSGNTDGNCGGGDVSDGLGNVDFGGTCNGLDSPSLGSANLGSPELTFSLGSIITFTRPLNAGSAALGFGRNDICDDSPYPLNFDQRLFPRPLGDPNCDSGAYESALLAPPTATPTATITNTATATSTATPSNTPTDTSTPTPSSTPTQTLEPGAYSGLLQVCDETFDRPEDPPSSIGAPTALDPAGADTYYETITFTVDTTGSYNLAAIDGGATDTFFILYSPSFDPVNPLTNALDTDYASASGAPGFTLDLTSGTTYILVTAGYTPSDLGPYTNSITGAGSVTFVSDTITTGACPIAETATPTGTPSGTPSGTPTGTPTETPTASPTLDPSVSPSPSPTASPSGTPTETPTASPTLDPSVSPSPSPTATPTLDPSITPTITPTASPLTPGTSTVVPPVLVIADPLVTKAVNPPFALPGEVATWTITISNPGTVAVTNVALTDSVPDVVAIESVNATAGSISFNGQVVTFTLASLAPGQTVTITIVTRVRENAALPFVAVNTAQLTSSGGSASASATLTGVSELPATGETPDFFVRWGGVIVLAMIALVLFVLTTRRRTPSST